MDINLYLGYEYFSGIKKLKRGMSGPVEGPAKLHHRVRQKSWTRISGCEYHLTLLIYKAPESYSISWADEQMFCRAREKI